MRRLPPILGLSLLLALLPLAPAGVAGSLKGSNVYSGSAIVSQPMGENLCALTFDDGPSNYTPRLLDLLDEHGVTATFFMLGRNAQRLPNVVRRVVAEGHEVGIHTWSHPNLMTVGPLRRRAEIGDTLALLRTLGADPVILRPPYGNRDPQVDELAAEMGLRVILWSHDSLDWKMTQADYGAIPDAYGRVAKDGSLRGIFLFHDIHRHTIDDLPRIVEQLRAAGCQRFVTVSEYLDGTFTDPEPPMCLVRHPSRWSLDPRVVEAAAPRRPVAAPLPATGNAMDEAPGTPLTPVETFKARTWVAPSAGDLGVLARVPVGMAGADLARVDAFAHARPWEGLARDSTGVLYAAPLVVTPSLPDVMDALDATGVPRSESSAVPEPSAAPQPARAQLAASPAVPVEPAPAADGTVATARDQASSVIGGVVDRAHNWLFGRVTEDAAAPVIR